MFAAFIFVGLLVGLIVLAVSLARAAQGYTRGPKPPHYSGRSPITSNDVCSPILFHSAANDASSSHHASSAHDGSPSSAHDCSCDSSCGCDTGGSCDSGGGGGSCGCD